MCRLLQSLVMGTGLWLGALSWACVFTRHDNRNRTNASVQAEAKPNRNNRLPFHFIFMLLLAENCSVLEHFEG